MITISKRLPKTLLEKDVFARSSYSNELAWDFETLLSITEYLQEQKYFILACDTYRFHDGELWMEDDEWRYTGDSPMESITQFLVYLHNYHEQYGEDYRYVITVSEARLFFLRYSKYDKQYRNELGHYLRDDWTSISDIGKVCEGVLVTQDEYNRIEDAYISVLRDIALEMSIKTFEISYLERNDFDTSPFDFEITIGACLTLEQALTLSRHILREEVWCKLVSPQMQYHFGYDYYAYVYFAMDKEKVKSIIEKHHLFWEDIALPYF